MELDHLFDGELRYTQLESLDYGAGGQFYGTLDGRLTGNKISGAMHLTNLAARRPDNVNLPAKVYLELNGIATLRPADNARVFVTSLSFRTGDSRYGWLNTVMAVTEGVLDTAGTGGVARFRAYQCNPTVR